MPLTRRTPLRAKKALKAKRLKHEDRGFSLSKGEAIEVPAGHPLCDTLRYYAERGLLSKASSFKAKPKPMKKRRETKGPTQMDVFMEIWAESESKCCEVCGTGIASMQPANFSHLLPKGSYRKYKLDKRNIVLKCIPCHCRWHDFGPDNLDCYDVWAPICERYYALRNEANGVNS